jgi:hypothetical protein
MTSSNHRLSFKFGKRTRMAARRTSQRYVASPRLSGGPLEVETAGCSCAGPDVDADLSAEDFRGVRRRGAPAR